MTFISEELSLYLGCCLESMKKMADNSVDSIVTDPPYGLSFMGKAWDYDVPRVEIWREALRVLKPGGHLLAFAGTRTQHRMAVNIEDAGFEIRDMISWVYGSGYPKSTSISKRIDIEEKNRWSKLIKAIDNINLGDILTAWKKNLETVDSAEILSAKRVTGAGDHMPRKYSALVTAQEGANPKKSNALATIAELRSIEALPTLEKELSTVPANARATIKPLQSPVRSVRRVSGDREASQSTITPTAPNSAKVWLSEKITGKLRAAEALKTWLGRKRSSSVADTAALCAALTEDLKRITLSQSKIFQSLDTSQQTDCVFATSVTITEYTAERLILNTVDTLRSKAIDKLAGAEREVISEKPAYGLGGNGCLGGHSDGATAKVLGAPATPDAVKWDGWGTAIKPAVEPITVARKPFKGTVAANVLKHGTGGINIDGCRVGTDDLKNKVYNNSGKDLSFGGTIGKGVVQGNAEGRFPANFIHDGSPEVVQHFPGIGDKSAARFFYVPKTSKADRDEGLDGFAEGPPPASARGVPAEGRSSALGQPRKNLHPTVKPTDLMRYLCRLVTPSGGVVLDPFMGSGSTGKAAALEGFKFVGCELSPEYFAIAEARIFAAHL